MVIDFETELKKVLDDLWRCSKFLMRNNEEASELYQDTILNALKFFRKNKNPNILNFKKWIMTILFNAAKNRYRKKNYVSLDDIDIGEFADEDHTKYENISIGNIYENLKDDFGALLQNALSRLEPEHREILLAVEILDYSYKEIVEILDIPIGTVMSRLNRARKRLKYLLANSIHKLNIPRYYTGESEKIN